MTQCRWPLPPKPRDWEDLETWVRRALDRAGRGARNLDQAGEATLERLRGMRSGAVMARMVEGVAVWMEIEAGQTAGDQLREVVRRMSHRPTDIPDRRRSHIISDQPNLQSID